MSNLVGVMIFGAVVIALEVSVMIFRGRSWGDNSIRIVGLSFVVIAGLILVFSGIGGEQMTAVFTLLGTVAGYLAGKTAKPDE
jgi:hypothetical protein